MNSQCATSSAVIEIIIDIYRDQGVQPLTTVDSQTKLGDIGLDSLMLTEFTSRLADRNLHADAAPNFIENAESLLKLSIQEIADAIFSSNPKCTPAESNFSDTIDDRIKSMTAQAESIRSSELYLFHPLTDKTAGTALHTEGNPKIAMGSYSYLGLSNSKAMLDGAFESARKFGAGTFGVPILAGYNTLYVSLEQTLCSALHADAACLFSSGYITNVETIKLLVGPGDRVIGDALNHTSIVEGCIQSRATFLTFPHNDVERLRQLLTNSRPGRTLVVVDGVYSMEGDVAPIPEIAELCRQYGAKLMVDEAHSFGVIGQSGMGVQDHFSLPPDAIDIKMGTLSKAMGAQGGFICGNHNLVTALKHNAKGYLFSGAIPPPVLGAALANLQTLIQNPDLARQAQRNRNRFAALCLDHGLPVLHPENLVAAIVPILMPTNEIAYRVTKICRERGLFVVPVIFPAVPKDAPRLRCCVMANHSESELEMAAATIAAALRLATS